MGQWAPPYLGKETKARKAELVKATREEKKIEKKLELARSYREFCEEMLKEAEANEQSEA